MGFTADDSVTSTRAFGLLVVRRLTAASGSISVYVESSHRERERERDRKPHYFSGLSVRALFNRKREYTAHSHPSSFHCRGITELLLKMT